MAREGLLRRSVAELIGTFALVAVGPGAVMVAATTHTFGNVGISLAFGLVITLCVASLGHISGAHINPAVTLGFWSIGRFPARDVVAYVIAQCCGAVAAAALLRWLLGPVATLGATAPALTVDRAFAIEMGYSALLAFVIVSVATDDRSPPGVAPFAIGATVFAGALVTGPLTGGSFNPARSFGPALVSGVWTAHWIYWLAPISGMLVAMRAYRWLGTDRAATSGALHVQPIGGHMAAPQTQTHAQTEHTHVHGHNCGHARITHDGHQDYLHDGHLHYQNGSKVEEHTLPVSATNPAACTPDHQCSGHDKAHRHGAGCGHDAVPHGDHVDYLVSGHLHHVHAGHCDDHGPVTLS